MVAQIVRLALGPLLLLQGRAVRRDVLRLPEPGGARAGHSGNGRVLRVVIIGDSSAAGVGCATQTEALCGQLVHHLEPRYCIHWRLLAQTGWTTREAEPELARLGDERFDVALCCLGVNDITTETAIGRWLEAYGRICARLHDRHKVARIFISGLPPMSRFPALPQPLRWYLGQQVARYEDALADWCRDHPLATHLPLDLDMQAGDMAIDGFHPGPKIYAAWAEVVARHMRDWADRNDAAIA